MTEETKQGDSIIELTDVVDDGGEEEDLLPDHILSEDEIPEDSSIELTDMEDFSGFEMETESDVEEIGMENSLRDEASGDRPIPEDEDAAEQASVLREATDLEELSVSEAQLEAALERFIEKKVC